MADPMKTDSSAPPSRHEEDRLAHALVSRGLLTREEAQQARGEQPVTAKAFLQRLVEKQFLTLSQAKRALQELGQLLNQQIPGFQLLEQLGQGAMGTVFKARQLSMNRLVAIKVLHPKWAAKGDDYLERFQREARVAAKLSHNNIVQAIDVGVAGTVNYFVMEYVEGTTIREQVDKKKIYEEKEAVEIILQIAQALSHAHRRGLIHRDIKPANIMLTPEGIAKLADLGMARETADATLTRKERGLTIGTPFYISPEQIEAKPDVDVRADLYSLGATLYHMVTGRPPFLYREVDKILDAHLSEELTPPDHLNQQLSSGLGEVAELLMAKNRKVRYQTPDDLIIDLECLLNGEAPKLARQKIEAGTLSALSEGSEEGEEEEEEEEERERPSRSRPAMPVNWMWLAILGALLAVSLLVNLILLVR